MYQLNLKFSEKNKIALNMLISYSLNKNISKFCIEFKVLKL